MSSPTTERLRHEPAPFGIRESEAVCSRCHLVFNEGGFSWGLCPDCFTDLVVSKEAYA